MRAAPARLVIEALLVPLNTVPTEKMLSIVRIDELDHMIGFAIAPFATVNFCVFYSHSAI